MFTSFCLLPSTNWSFFLSYNFSRTPRSVLCKSFFVVCCLPGPLTAVLVINNNWFLLSFHFKVLIAKSWWQPNEGWHKACYKGVVCYLPSHPAAAAANTHVSTTLPAACTLLVFVIELIEIAGNFIMTWKPFSNSLVHFQVRLMPVERPVERAFIIMTMGSLENCAKNKATIDFGLSLIMDAIHYTIYEYI